MIDRWQWLMLFLILVLGGISHWIMALLGEEGPLWFWRDVMGVL